MRAVGVSRYGDATGMEMFEIPVPEPALGEILVEIALAGVNHLDISLREGRYAHSMRYPTMLPLVLGIEGAGTVAAVGRGVQGFREGDRVAFWLGKGSYADFVCVDAGRAVRVPPSVTLEQATTLQMQGLTAHYLATDAFPVRAGDVCLVTGAAGGVGQFLIQGLKGSGARVIAVTSRDKAETVRARGADYVVDADDARLAERVRDLTRGHGADVVFDAVGRSIFDRALPCLHRRGVYVAFGDVSGEIEPIAPRRLGEAGSVYFVRPHLVDFVATRQELQDRMDILFDLCAKGALTCAFDSVLPLEEADTAHARLEQRAASGKVLLDVKRPPASPSDLQG